MACLSQEEQRRLRTCLICEDHVDTYHLNYGASTCLGCRAFFRRTIQNGKSENLRCSGVGSGCAITPSSRRKCQKCRFQKCIDAGMKAQCVLNEAGKMKRFRKMYKKQMKEAVRSGKSQEKLIFPSKRKRSGGSRSEGDQGSPAPAPSGPQLSIQISENNHYQPTGISPLVGPPQMFYGANMGESQMSNESHKVSADWLIQNGYSAFVPQKLVQKFHHANDVKGFNSHDTTDLFAIQNAGRFTEQSCNDESVHNAQVEQGLIDYATEACGKEEQILSIAVHGIQTEDETSMRPPLPFDDCEVSEMDHASTSSSYLDWNDSHKDENTIFCPSYCTKDRKFRQRMKKYTVHLERTLQNAVEKVKYADNSKWLDNLLCFHKGIYAPLNRNEFKGYLIRLARIFKFFALQQPEFISLSKGDQRRLLNFNAPVFIQYILSRYINADSAIEQLRWLTMESNIEEKAKDMMLSKINLNTFSNRLGLFDDESGESVKWKYEEFLENMSNCEIKFSLCPLIALACLYHTKGIGLLDDFLTIEGHHVNVMLLADWSNEVYGTTANSERLYTWLNNLKAMSNIFEEGIQWDNSAQGNNFQVALSHCMDVSFSSETDFWLQSQLMKFSSAYSSISFGEGLLNSYVNFVQNDYLDPSFGFKAKKLFRQRFGAILKIHPEFRQLPDALQIKIMKKNSLSAFCLLVSRTDMAINGLEQAAVSQGDSDKDLIHTIYKRFFENQHNKTPVTTRVVNKFCNLLTNDEVVQTESLARKLIFSLNNAHDYKLLTLILLTDCSELRHVNRCYEKMYLQSQPTDSEHFDNRFQELQSVRRNVKTFRNILAKFTYSKRRQALEYQ